MDHSGAAEAARENLVLETADSINPNARANKNGATTRTLLLRLLQGTCGSRAHHTLYRREKAEASSSIPPLEKNLGPYIALRARPEDPLSRGKSPIEAKWNPPR